MRLIVGPTLLQVVSLQSQPFHPNAKISKTWRSQGSHCVSSEGQALRGEAHVVGVECRPCLADSCADRKLHRVRNICFRQWWTSPLLQIMLPANRHGATRKPQQPTEAVSLVARKHAWRIKHSCHVAQQRENAAAVVRGRCDGRHAKGNRFFKVAAPLRQRPLPCCAKLRAVQRHPEVRARWLHSELAPLRCTRPELVAETPRLLLRRPVLHHKRLALDGFSTLVPLPATPSGRLGRCRPSAAQSATRRPSSRSKPEPSRLDSGATRRAVCKKLDPWPPRTLRLTKDNLVPPPTSRFTTCAPVDLARARGSRCRGPARPDGHVSARSAATRNPRDTYGKAASRPYAHSRPQPHHMATYVLQPYGGICPLKTTCGHAHTHTQLKQRTHGDKPSHRRCLAGCGCLADAGLQGKSLPTGLARARSCWATQEAVRSPARWRCVPTSLGSVSEVRAGRGPARRSTQKWSSSAMRLV